ncbi:hypothetical protein I548_5864 [Mycobacterium intracellulare]|nr:hypothetical protein I548_5864 [Mycobacterium intracellulare]
MTTEATVTQGNSISVSDIRNRERRAETSDGTGKAHQN